MMYGVEYRQTQEQKTALSHKMIQSAEILQTDAQGLGNYVQQQALENPLVDLEELGRRGSDSFYETEDGAPREADEFMGKLEQLNHTDERNRIYYSEDYGEVEGQDPWNVSREGNSLENYVLSRLVMRLRTDRGYECMEFLIYGLDSRGYLTDDVKELQQRLGVGKETMGRYLELLQSVESVGMGVQSLEDCLQIQLKRMQAGGCLDEEDFDALMTLAGSYMRLLGRKHSTRIAEKMDISMGELLRYYEVIRGLNPIPGNSLSSREEMRYIKPDVTVVKFEDYFEILVNDVNIPRISVNRQYLNMVNEDASSRVLEHLQNRYRQIQWVQRHTKDRANTLQKMAREMAAIQGEFFESPGGKRMPMSLGGVAEQPGIHESTVSRAVKDKFLRCAWGIYPMDYFFVRKVAASTAGGRTTPELVRLRIQEPIQERNKKKPLNNQKVTDLLKGFGIEVSRRTVAEYRDEMMIAGASGRKNLT